MAITTRDRVRGYHDYQEKYKLPKLIYRKGKWYHDDPKLPYKKYIYDIRHFLYYIDIHTEHDQFNRKILHFNEPCEVDNFVKMYADMYGEDGEWFETKYAVLGRKYCEEHPILPEQPFWLDHKQLAIIGVLLYMPKEEVLFITTGIGGSGKSTFLNIIKQLFNNDFYSATLSELTETHTMSEAVQKSLICGDEIGTKEINLDNLKVLASKQYVSVNPKFERPYIMKSQSAIFYCCNKVPPMDLTDSGIMRRMVYYKKNEKIEKPDIDLKDKVYSEKELTVIAAYAYKYLKPNWRDMFKDETWELISSVNSVCRYDKRDDGDYDLYVKFCRNDGLHPCGKPNYDAIKELIKEHEGEKEDEELPF